MMAGVNFVLHAAGWLEGGLAIGYEKFVLDDDQLGMMATFVQGPRPVARTARRSTPSARTRPASTSSARPTRSPTSRRRSTAPTTADNSSFEQWTEDGGARRRPAGQQALEAAPRRLRAAADRRGHRRGAAGVHRPPQGRAARLVRLTGVLCQEDRRLASCFLTQTAGRSLTRRRRSSAACRRRRRAR